MKKILMLVAFGFAVNALAKPCVIKSQNLNYECKGNFLLTYDYSVSDEKPVGMHSEFSPAACQTAKSSHETAKLGYDKFVTYSREDLSPTYQKSDFDPTGYQKCGTVDYKKEQNTKEEEENEKESSRKLKKVTDESKKVSSDASVPVKKCEYIKPLDDTAGNMETGCSNQLVRIEKVICTPEEGPAFETVIVCKHTNGIEPTDCYNQSEVWAKVSDGKLDVKLNNEESTK